MLGRYPLTLAHQMQKLCFVWSRLSHLQAVMLQAENVWTREAMPLGSLQRP